MKPSHLTGVLLALGAATIYGAVPNFARLAFLNGVPALENVFYRTSTVAVVLAIVAVVRGESFRIRAEAWPSFLYQCLATLMVSACYLASVQFLPVTLSVIIFYLFPVLILLAAPLAEGRVPGFARLGVALLGFSGLAVSVGPAFDQVSVLGLVLAFLGAVGCMMQFFSGRMLSRHLTPAAFGSLVHIAIWPIMLCLALGFGGNTLRLIDGQALTGSLAFLAVALVSVAYVGGYFLHMSSVRAAPSSVVAPYFNLEPIVSTMLAVFILGEAMSINQWIGGAMVFAALVISGLLPEK
ncbi:MAG: DMT family transporter [Rhizobiales bacterium]|nr:DMT family transporter [Hyphomicrobiales bacterium]